MTYGMIIGNNPSNRYVCMISDILSRYSTFECICSNDVLRCYKHGNILVADLFYSLHLGKFPLFANMNNNSDVTHPFPCEISNYPKEANEKIFKANQITFKER